MLKVAIFYNYYLFTNTIFYLADCSFNGCQKYFYEKLADTVLYCTPGYTSFPKDGISSEKNENLNAFFNQYKRRFFERRSLKRPVYTLKLDQEGKIVRDKNGILVVFVNSYVQGELKTTKQLLYREALDGVLSSLHNIKGVLGEDTCLPGGVNALSRLFNQKYVFKGIFNLIRAFLARCSTCQINNPCFPLLSPLDLFAPILDYSVTLLTWPQRRTVVLCRIIVGASVTF